MEEDNGNCHLISSVLFISYFMYADKHNTLYLWNVRKEYGTFNKTMNQETSFLYSFVLY